MGQELLSELAERLDNPNLDTLVQNIADAIRKHAAEVGGEKKASDILSSRFMSAQQAYDKGFTSCGNVVNISAEILRKLGHEVKLVHGSCAESPTHAWINVKGNDGQWHTYDLTRRDLKLTPESVPEYTVESWEEIRRVLERWHFGQSRDD